MLFNKEIEGLHNDCFEGSVEEHHIFTEVFFGNDSGRSSSRCLSTGIIKFESDYMQNSDVSTRSNSENSAITIQEDSRENSGPGCLLEENTLVISKYPDTKVKRIKLSVDNPRWNKSCFVELDIAEKSMPRDSMSDPRPLLRYHINRLLMAMGWVVGKRKRANKNNGIGEYIYRSPEGRPIREFHRVWSLCGQSLFAVANNVAQESVCRQWADLTQFFFDLSKTSIEIKELDNLGTITSFARRWCLLDPFATVVFIDKTFGSLKVGKIAKAKRSFVIDSHSKGDIDLGPKELDFVSLNVKSKSLNSQIWRRDINMKKTGAEDGQKNSFTCQLKDDDLLISAIIKTKRSSAKKISCKSKTPRKYKSQKASCRLLTRSLIKGGKHGSSKRTVLSWLINSGVLSLNEVIQYRNPKDDALVIDGLITPDGILCRCCDKMLSLSEFKSHAGFRLNRPCLNLFMESGKSFTLCQLEAWSAEYKARKSAIRAVQVDVMDQSDDRCGLCGDGGELICCDNCPSTFHQPCLHAQELPEGSWYCSHCTCRICGDLVNDKEASKFHGALKCLQCDHKYHEGCLKEKDIKRGVASDTWFCGNDCREVYSGLHSRIGLMNLISNGFSWTILRCIHGDQKVHSTQRSVAFKAECNLKLAVALTIMEECFLPMVDPITGIDMIPHLLYNWGSQYARLNYHGFRTVVLEKDDVLMSVASVRIHGAKVAEMPLIATCSKYRRQGMCRRLMNAIEEMLKSFRVEKLVISAIPSSVETWTVGFGFKLLEDNERQNLSNINLMVLPGTIWLKKPLYHFRSAQEMGTDDPTETGACLEEDRLPLNEQSQKINVLEGNEEYKYVFEETCFPSETDHMDG